MHVYYELCSTLKRVSGDIKIYITSGSVGIILWVRDSMGLRKLFIFECLECFLIYCELCSTLKRVSGDINIFLVSVGIILSVRGLMG